MKAGIIKAVHDAGLRVWMRDPDDTWLIYGDDKDRIAYLQADRGGHCTISSLHVPHRNIGSGFAIDDIPALTREHLDKGFVFAPGWALSRDVDFVRKYANFEDFRTSTAWNEKYKEKHNV